MARTLNPTVEKISMPAARMAGFTEHLRLNDFPIGPKETIDALGFIKTAGWSRAGAVKLGLKTMMSANKSNWDVFDELFDAYWFGRGVKTVKRLSRGYEDRWQNGRKHPKLWDRSTGHGRPARTGDISGEPDDGLGDDTNGASTRNIASARETLEKADLSTLVSAQDVAQVEQLAGRLARAMRYRLSRRWNRSIKGRAIDMRATIRRNISKGGEPFDLVFRKRPDRPVKLVILLDVSGSMRQYSRFFLAFVRGLLGQWLHVDAFMFHTSLVCVSDALRDKDHVRAMERLTLLAKGFGGGTRIGESLGIFNRQYAKKILNSRSIVIIMSDGYDTGDSDGIARQLVRLKKRARRLIWLNPLAGGKDYEPVARGMAEALPHIDLFRAANTLESLAALEPELARL